MSVATALFLTVACWQSPAARDWSKFPDWAQSALRGFEPGDVPEHAAMIRLLDETRVALRRDGRFEQRRRIVQYVLDERGAEAAALFLIDGDAKGAKIKKLRGWRQRANGYFDKLDRDNVVTVGLSNSRQITSGAMTFGFFEGVSTGAAIAFESREIHETFFSANVLGVMTPFPIRKRVIRLSSQGDPSAVKIIPIQFEAWNLDYTLAGTTLEIRDIPGLEQEAAAPDFVDPYPRVMFGFISPSDPLASWDNMAAWYFRLFNQSALGPNPPPAGNADNAEDLRGLAAAVAEKISYRQRYMTLARGWTPAPGATVARRAYGDCKDMVACLSHFARGRNIATAPVLASIADGQRVSPSDPPGPWFNHLIAAIPLTRALGMAAEVDVGGQRYLLHDPTAKYTPLGWMPAHYRGRRVVISSPEGALWVDIPDSALAPESLEVEIVGMLDGQYTLSGSIQIVEEGDAYFLRTIAGDGNPLDVEMRLRDQFEIPGVVDLIPSGQKVDDQGKLTLLYQVKWPSFLRRDAGGLRPPRCMIGTAKRSLDPPGRPRQNPIAFDGAPPTRWRLSFRSQTPLTAGRLAAEHHGEHHGFSWKVEGGNPLTATLETSRKAAYFPKAQVSDGLAYWRRYRQAYNRFWLDGAIFYTQPAP